MGVRERRGGYGKEGEHISRSPRMGKGIETHPQNRMGLIRASFLEETSFEPGFIGQESSWGRKQVMEEGHVPN